MNIAETWRNVKRSQTSRTHVRSSFLLRLLKTQKKKNEAYMVAIVTRFIAYYL
jgi:hypothetical protein